MFAGLPNILVHQSPLLRALAGWLIGLALFAVSWSVSYLLLPDGSGTLWASVASRLPLGGTGDVPALALQIFAWNLLVGVGTTGLASLFAVGHFPLGYLAPWAWFLIYGVLLGTNSFAIPSPEGRLAPDISVLWTRSGLREITAYTLVAAALAGHHQWQQRSWWDWRVERVAQWREVRLSRSKSLCLLAALGLLAWAAFVEASQIIEG